ncbi:MAG: DUF5320 domain-containing protein [Candidatus Cloacimonetes bacterium]|nr:DUF5320 domain-containing protein [Candidatus Cloacimonadota bacterium]MDD2507031.1 DUF5320 domain-containing protein [Candidatus Cloacimonadota bacterium]MDD4148327.1 DUF5320 domain-containing protein [Candidatus Cloacimonadota bacterium]MDD4559905.1 DUF5320 domain-containing protein [Candidatus Cloacimonadota bacterium]
MPRMDGTGPWGMGQLGREMGPCGRGAGCGRGRGLGARFRTRLTDNAGFSDMYPYNKDSLQTQKQELEAQLNWINNELNKEQ